MTSKDNVKYFNSQNTQQRLTYAVNYNKWLFGHVRESIGNRVLEVGCALGNITRNIIDKEYVCAIDIEEEYIKTISESFSGKSNFRAVKCDILSPESALLKDDRFDTILCFNVLEHIKDDDIALRNMYQLLDARGSLCLIVPAFQSIFGSMDLTDNHYRRYSKSDLVEKVKAAGFSVVKAKYINLLGFLSWWFNGRILKRKFIPFYQMLAYNKMIPAISAVEGLFNLPFGQSLVLVATKE